jgi:hypothetical protein
VVLGYKFKQSYAVQCKLYTGDILRELTRKARGMAAGEGAAAGTYLFACDLTDELSPDSLYAAFGSFASGKRDIGNCVISWVRLKGNCLRSKAQRRLLGAVVGVGNKGLMADPKK